MRICVFNFFIKCELFSVLKKMLVVYIGMKVLILYDFVFFFGIIIIFCIDSLVLKYLVYLILLIENVFW